MLSSQYSSRGSIPGSYYGTGAASRTTTPDTVPSSSGHSNGSPTVFQPAAGCSHYCSGVSATLHPNYNGSADVTGTYGSEGRRGSRETHRYSMPGNRHQNRTPLLQNRSPSIVRLNECKHFHYESVELGPITVQLLSEFSENCEENFSLPSNGANVEGGEKDVQTLRWTFSVESNEQKWFIRRTFHELAEFDRQLHRCVFERRHSRLRELATVMTEFSGTITTSGSTASTSGFVSGGGTYRQADDFSNNLAMLREEIVLYVDRLSQLTGSLIKCYPVLKFLELDSRGNHFLPIENSKINTPAIAVAIVISDFVARDSDQLSLRVGDIVSVIEMDAEPSDNNTTKCFWRGKLTVPSATKASEKRKKGGRKLVRSSSKIVHSSLNKDERVSHIKRASEGGGAPADENIPPTPRFQVGYFPRECVRLFTDKLDFDKPISQPSPHQQSTNSSAANRSAPRNQRNGRRESTPTPPPIATGSVRSYLGVKSKFGRWQSERRPLIKSLLNVFLDSTDPATPADQNELAVGKVFGVDLQTHLLHSGREVPLVLTSCISVIENHGIVTGIYRQCGIQSNIRRLRWEFDNGIQPNLLERGILCDIHCVASLLKQYFRQLPNPLFTYELYDQLVDAYDFGGGSGTTAPQATPTACGENVHGSASTANTMPNGTVVVSKSAASASRTAGRIVALQTVLRRLPLPHFRTAMCLMKHLSRVSKHKEITDMTASNLAIVWAPNLIRCPPQNGATNDAHLLMGLDLHKSMCNFLISHASAIFGPTLTGASAEGVTNAPSAKNGANSKMNFHNYLTVPGESTPQISVPSTPTPTGDDALENDAKRSRRCVDVKFDRNTIGTSEDFSDFHTVLMPRRGSRKRSTATSRKESVMSASTRSNTAKLESEGSHRENDPFSSWRRFFTPSKSDAAEATAADGPSSSSGGSGFWRIGGANNGSIGGVGRRRNQKRRPQLSLEGVANRSRSVDSTSKNSEQVENAVVIAAASDHASPNGSVRWRNSALVNLGRNMRDTVIRRMRTARQRRHDSATVVTQSLDETMPLATLEPIRTLKFQPLSGESIERHSSQFALSIVNNATVLRQRLEKHNSVSPSLMRRQMPAGTAMPSAVVPSTSSTAAHATSLSLHRPQRRASQTQQQQPQQHQQLSNSVKRSSLLFASKFEYVDESDELDGQPERREGSRNGSNGNRDRTRYDKSSNTVDGYYGPNINDTVDNIKRQKEDVIIPAHLKNSYNRISAPGYSSGSPLTDRRSILNSKLKAVDEKDRNGNYLTSREQQMAQGQRQNPPNDGNCTVPSEGMTIHTSLAARSPLVGSPCENAVGGATRKSTATSVDVSSSESLPLDVSRYDNVAPQAANLAALRMQARLRNSSKARFNRPTSTPLMMSGDDAPPIPTRSFPSPPPASSQVDALPSSMSPHLTARKIHQHKAMAAVASDGSALKNLYYF